MVTTQDGVQVGCGSGSSFRDGVELPQQQEACTVLLADGVDDDVGVGEMGASQGEKKSSVQEINTFWLVRHVEKFAIRLSPRAL